MWLVEGQVRRLLAGRTHRLPELFNSADPETAGRVGQALFSMKKIIIADLEAAAAG